LPSKMTSASVAIPAFRQCLPSRCIAMDYYVTIIIIIIIKGLIINACQTCSKLLGTQIINCQRSELNFGSKKEGTELKSMLKSYVLSARTTHRKHSTVLLRSADHIENTASYIVACWIVFTYQRLFRWLDSKYAAIYEYS
jgi:hypothetical protein